MVKVLIFVKKLVQEGPIGTRSDKLFLLNSLEGCGTLTIDETVTVGDMARVV